MISRNIKHETIDMIKNCGINLDTWLKGFDDIELSVKSTVNIIKNHPLIPQDIDLFGFIINPKAGELTPIV